MAEITVPVPDERTAEFYQFFGLWLAGSLSLQASTSGAPGSPPEASGASEPVKIKVTPWGDTEQDLADAAALWEKYSPRARKMFSLLIDNPETEFTGGQIAEACDIPNGVHGVAGVLAWPGRHGYAVGRGLPMHWREDPETFEGIYWMPASRAALFRAAREQVEGGAT